MAASRNKRVLDDLENKIAKIRKQNDHDQHLQSTAAFTGYLCTCASSHSSCRSASEYNLSSPADRNSFVYCTSPSTLSTCKSKVFNPFEFFSIEHDCSSKLHVTGPESASDVPQTLDAQQQILDLEIDIHSAATQHSTRADLQHNGFCITAPIAPDAIMAPYCAATARHLRLYSSHNGC